MVRRKTVPSVYPCCAFGRLLEGREEPQERTASEGRPYKGSVKKPPRAKRHVRTLGRETRGTQEGTMHCAPTRQPQKQTWECANARRENES